MKKEEYITVLVIALLVLAASLCVRTCSGTPPQSEEVADYEMPSGS